MSGQAPALDDSTIQWDKEKSKNGVSYETGREKSEVAVQDKKPFGVAVNWPVENKWKDLTPELAAITGIKQYALFDNRGFYKFRLEFINTETYSYHFSDDTGDSYGVNTFYTGSYYVKYNSDNPTIKWVSGS